jgi:peptidoglycan/LPS O-acetylase OafA/YrhL
LKAKQEFDQESITTLDFKLPTTNNLDMIRLFAAAQVAIEHAAKHLQYENAWISWISLFPGVPIFFFISGFLIYGSYVKSTYGERPLVNFYSKRVLRLYPALWFCLGLSAALVWMSGYLDHVDDSASDFVTWALTSGTIFQFYNPEFLRGFGLGAINGSLWTISVEIQFYLLTPLVFWLLNRNLFFVVAIIVIFCVANTVNSYFNPREDIIGKLLEVSFIPWIYMFIIGALVSKYPFIVREIRDASFLIISVVYMIAWYISTKYELIWGNEINPIGYLILVCLLLKIAFSYADLSDSILKRNDISYGIYIFHMPIVNFLIYKKSTGLEGFIVALIFTLVVALGSWFLIERPALRLKSYQLRHN